MNVISYKNLPTRLPYWQTVTLYLFLEHTNAADWVQGVLWTLAILAWVVAVYCVYHQKQIDIFADRK